MIAEIIAATLKIVLVLGVVSLVVAYLTYLEAFVIRAWCYWCVTSAVIITAIWILSIFDLRKTWSEA